jgi:hypothetical protein
MDTTSWVLVILASIYALFNIKKIYNLILFSWSEMGGIRTLFIILFFLILFGGAIIGTLVPRYGEIFRWAFILYIVGFFVYRLIWGTRYYDKES